MATNGISGFSASSQPPIPIFDGYYYEFWSTKMKTLFRSQGLWECIEDGYDAAENDESEMKDAKALFLIQQSLSDSLFPLIASATSSKQAWQALQTQFQGPAKVLQDEDLDVDLFNAAMRGDETIFDDPNLSIERLSRIGVENNNILHIAIRYKQASFVHELLSKTDREYEEMKMRIICRRNTPFHVVNNKFLRIALRNLRYERRSLLSKTDPEYVEMIMRLICGRNTHGNTPFHVAAQIHDDSSVRQMRNYYLRELRNMMVAPGHDGGVGGGSSVGGGDDSDDVEEEDEYVYYADEEYEYGGGGRSYDEEDDVGNDDEERPWRAKNSEGNTPLHLALLNGHDSVAFLLVSRDPSLASIVNNSLQAPLHLALTRSHVLDWLLRAAKYVVSWRDAKGFTPLHRLALLSDYSRDDLYSSYIELAQKMIEACPQSTLVCDPSGKSFLHLLALNKSAFDDKLYHEELFDLICRPEMSAVRNLQDEDGNTPLHLALKCDNIPMVKLLWRLWKSEQLEVFIRNKDGIDAWSIIEERGLHSKIAGEPRTMTENECNSAMLGDVKSLRELYRECKSRSEFNFCNALNAENRNFFHLLLSNTTERRNYFSDEYCDEFLRYNKQHLCYVKVVYQMDNDGNTPLHILAQNTSLANEAPTLLSHLLSECFALFYDEAEGHDQPPLWMMQNKSGNTPLHEAIIANNIVFVLKSLIYSLKSAVILNNRRETPLHLLAGTTTSMVLSEVEEIIKKVVNAYPAALQLQDEDGLIPMLRAISVENKNVLVVLICNFQDFSNTNGETLWQIFLQKHQINNFFKGILQEEGFKEMLKQNNEDGNTPLHIAIQDNGFDFVEHLLVAWNMEQDYKPLRDLLTRSNKLGQTSEELLADLPTLSKQLEEKLLIDPRMRGIRSSWKIPRTQLQNYMSSMNVIAALQTTITFTAAFTVPGGLNQDKGTPILMQSIPFQVFMILDVVAMCLSMMVLICLLWMVATDKRKSVMIQDFALTVLLFSFIATILTFMMGVFATIYPIKPWIAITNVVLCGLLMIVCLRRSFLIIVVRFFNHLKALISENMSLPQADSSNTQEQNMSLAHGDRSNTQEQSSGPEHSLRSMFTNVVRFFNHPNVLISKNMSRPQADSSNTQEQNMSRTQADSSNTQEQNSPLPHADSSNTQEQNMPPPHADSSNTQEQISGPEQV